MVELPDDAIEAAACATSGYSPEHYKRWRNTSKGQQYHDRAVAALTAAYPLIAARVRAEAQLVVASVEVAAARNPLLGTLYLHESLDFSRELVGAFERAVRAEAVAAERQRIAALIREHAGPEVSEGVCAGVQRWPAERARGYTAAINEVIEEVLDAAAGSVPVATPGSTEWAHVVAMPGQLTDKTLLEVLGLTDAEQAEVRGRLRAELDAIDRAERGISSGPVATPAGGFGAFSDSPRLAAARAAIEGLPVGTEGQTLTRAFAEGIAAVACRAFVGPVATPEPKAVLGPGTIVRRVATPTEPATMLREFHSAYGLFVQDRPALVEDADLVELRRALLEEEFTEYQDAVKAGDLIEIADALADMVYVIYGTALTYGVGLDSVLAEVHRSNMSKLGADGKPVLRVDGKIMKGPDFTPPDIAAVLAMSAASPVPAEQLPACSTCDGEGAIRQQQEIGAPGTGGWLTCPDCGPTPPRPAGQPEER